MTETVYHQILRSSLLVLILMLIFDGGFITPVSKHLSDNTISYLANSVGVFAQIEPNDLNVLTAELTRRQRELDEREAALRTIEARAFDTGSSPDYSTYILSLMIFILTVLIVGNYFLDWRRNRTLEYARA